MKSYYDTPPTPASEAIKGWSAWLVAAMREGVKVGEGVFAEPVPPLVAQARFSDFRAAHWAFDDYPSEREAVDPEEWATRVVYSPHWTRQALIFASEGREWGRGAAMWVDGEPVDVPLDARGDSRIDNWGNWLDERWFAAQLGGFDQHPKLAFKISALSLGNVLGVWVYDAVTRTSRSIAPPDDQLWADPSADLVDGRLVIYNSRKEHGQRHAVVWRDRD